MRKLATSLYAANRELKSILRNSKFGVTFSHLRETTHRISLLSDSDFQDLMEYTRQTGTVVQYRQGEENAFILITNIDESPAEPGKEDYHTGTIVFDPRKKEAVEEKKEERVPTIQNNREKPQVLNVNKYKDELTKVDPSLHVEAVEIMGTVDNRNFGATISELTRVCPRFDYLEPEQQKHLVELLHKTSINYSYVDAAGLPRRSPGVMVLVHNQYLGKEHFTWEDKTALPNNALADQLSALKGKIKLSPEPAKAIPSRPASVASSKPTAPNMVEFVVKKEPLAQEATPEPHGHTFDSLGAEGKDIKEAIAKVVGVETQPLDNGSYAITEDGISTTSLADIQKQLGECLGRIAMNQAQISVAQISINSANAAITNDVALMSKLNEELKKFVK